MLVGIVKGGQPENSGLRSYMGKKVQLKVNYYKGKVDTKFWAAHDIDTDNRIGGYYKTRFKIVKDSSPIRVRNIRCL